MNVIALERLKYKKVWRVPGTASAEFSFDKKDKKIAEELLAANKIVLPQTLEQQNQPAGQQEADKIIAAAELQAKELLDKAQVDAEERSQAIISGAETEAEGKAAAIVKAAEEQAKEIIKKAGEPKK